VLGGFGGPRGGGGGGGGLESVRTRAHLLSGGVKDMAEPCCSHPLAPPFPVSKSIDSHEQFCRLPCRFYDPQRGEVLLDGVPLPAIAHAHLHAQVALVAQEPVLFADTILNNIAFGCGREVGGEEVRKSRC
jgi:hypothetical protein